MRNDRGKGPATTALITSFESGLASLRLFRLTVEGWTDHLGWQPINRADQDEIRPTPSTVNPGPGSFLVGLVGRVCGPREPNEARLLPLGVVCVQAEAQTSEVVHLGGH